MYPSPILWLSCVVQLCAQSHWCDSFLRRELFPLLSSSFRVSFVTSVPAVYSSRFSAPSRCYLYLSPSPLTALSIAHAISRFSIWDPFHGKFEVLYKGRICSHALISYPWAHIHFTTLSMSVTFTLHWKKNLRKLENNHVCAHSRNDREVQGWKSLPQGTIVSDTVPCILNPNVRLIPPFSMPRLVSWARPRRCLPRRFACWYFQFPIITWLLP